MSATVHAAHVILAGVWFGGVIFTTTVVSPALKTMKWVEHERVLVRSKIGKQYAMVGGANLVLLVIFALLDGLLAGFWAAFYAEYLLLVVLLGLVAAHGAYFGRRLRELAEVERTASSDEEAHALAKRRRELQRLSLRVSWADLLISLAVVVIAINA